MGPIVFAVGERLGVEHADPMFEQIGALQALFQRIDVGDAKGIRGTSTGVEGKLCFGRQHRAYLSSQKHS